MKKILGFFGALSMFVACGGATLTVAENGATATDGGTPDGAKSTSKTLPDGASVCCPIDDHPGCCMQYGGTRKGDLSCAASCDGMPYPNDPGWHRETDESGCDYWAYTNTADAKPDLCGQVTPSGCHPACASSEICVSSKVVGGAQFPPDDAGACPTGRHLEGGTCQNDPTYHCAARPAACNGAVTCGCAAEVCSSQSSCPYTCESATSSQVNCVCPVP